MEKTEYGKIAEKYCDEIILTNEDPYDENPVSILEQIETGFSQSQSSRPQRPSAAMAGGTKPEISKIWKIIDRKEAIKKGVSLAKEGDIVIITGKGSESTMMIANGQKIPFDDRQTAREILKSL